METKLSIDATAIRRYPADDAVNFVDQVLGPSATWSQSLIGYRLSSEFQADWKCEVGCWLLLARDFGFLDALRKRLVRARREANDPETKGANDSAHRILIQELAGAMVAYYFVGMGWRFIEWEPSTESGDIDVRLATPKGMLVDIQVKAPDQPGERTAGQIIDGEYDERVLRRIDDAMKQLAHSPGPVRMVVVSPQRLFSMNADVIARHLVGTPVRATTGGYAISSNSRAAFNDETGQQISAVTDLGLLRGENETLYRCTVVINPWVSGNGVLVPEFFPQARVLFLDGDQFVWTPEQPSRCYGFPSGTSFVQTGGV